KQLRGNIYLAKVTRVEPSLQAAFVDYGGNRHGFLAFSEIHPDYYQIPVADRQALLAEDARAQRDADEEADDRGRHRRHRRRGAHRRPEVKRSEPLAGEAAGRQEFAAEAAESQPGEAAPAPDWSAESATALPEAAPESPPFSAEEPVPAPAEMPAGEEMHSAPAAGHELAAEEALAHDAEPATEAADEAPDAPPAGDLSDAGPSGNGDDQPDEEAVESVGGADALEEAQERAPRIRPRQYKIQEVIKRRQVMLVQVVKEERGTKGAALTTYLSLAGRYSVLMPNTARGGGISRKITSPADRKRLKQLAADLEVPEGMGVILRTAGATRTKSEVKRDFEYLLRLWENVRELTLRSTAPTLVYEEGSLIKRSIRDLYNKDIDEI